MTAVGTPAQPDVRRSSARPAPVRRPRAADQARQGTQRRSATNSEITARSRGITRVERGVMLAAVALAVTVVVVGISTSQALLVQSQARLDSVTAEIARQETIAEQQRLELAELQSPERIVAAATERLGMVAPGEVVFLRHDANDDVLIVRSLPQTDPSDSAEAVDPADLGDVSTATGG